MDSKLEKYHSHLRGSGPHSTVSSVNDEHTDWSQFDHLHQYMQETWPLIFEKWKSPPSTRRVSSSTGRWKIQKKEPVLFMAHQDVVPGAP